MNNNNNFTLMEVIVVLALILIIAGIVIPRIHGEPAYLVMSNTVNRINNVFLQAANESLAQGKNVVVTIKDRVVAIKEHKQAREDFNKSLLKSVSSYNIPENVKLSILRKDDEEVSDEDTMYSDDDDDEEDEEDDEDEEIDGEIKADRDTAVYTFYPDGSADGPAVELELEGEKVILHISPLTGMVLVKDITEDEFGDGDEGDGGNYSNYGDESDDGDDDN